MLTPLAIHLIDELEINCPSFASSLFLCSSGRYWSKSSILSQWAISYLAKRPCVLALRQWLADCVATLLPEASISLDSLSGGSASPVFCEFALFQALDTTKKSKGNWSLIKIGSDGGGLYFLSTLCYNTCTHWTLKNVLSMSHHIVYYR